MLEGAPPSMRPCSCYVLCCVPSLFRALFLPFSPYLFRPPPPRVYVGQHSHVGIDDGWQECGAGSELPTSFHNAAGTPLLNTSKFTNLASLVSYAAGYDMALGWYINNCICHESKARIHNDTWIDLTYHGDVKQIVEAGFAGVKIDSCGLHSDLEK